MSPLPAPWPGLALLAPRFDLWPALRALGSPEQVACATPAEWCAAGLPLPTALWLGKEGSWAVGGLHAGGPGWPACLDGLPKGPVALCAEGNLALLGRTGVGVVGARACTPYGRDQARRLAVAIVAAGGVVVSGLAAGIDSAAHEAAGGATIAVLGQGLRASMPDSQARLRGRILERGGLVLSEFRPEDHAQAWTFPVRNRIIAGLSTAVVVVEAGRRSGARNTARWAADYGRPVLAVPGQLGAPASEGCLDLIADGATMVRSPDSVLDAASLPLGTAAVTAPDRESRVLGALGAGATADDVVARVGLSRHEVQAALGVLELTRRIIRLPGARYAAR